MRPSTQAARCTAEHVQAAVDCATQCAACASLAAPARESLWEVGFKWVAVVYLTYTVSDTVCEALRSAIDKYRNP